MMNNKKHGEFEAFAGEKLFAALGNLDNELIEETKYFSEDSKAKVVGFRGGMSKGRRARLIIIAAVLVLTLGVTAFAIDKNQWNIDIINYMGLSDTDTSQLADGSVIIGEMDERNVLNLVTNAREDIWLKADSSIGDKQNAYLKVTSNIRLPKELTILPGYFVANNWQMEISDKKNQSHGKSWGGSLEAITEEGSVSFMINLQDVEKLNTSYVDLSLGEIEYNINWDELSEDEELYKEAMEIDYVRSLKKQGIDSVKLYDESWTLGWKYSYKSPEINKSIRKNVKVGDLTCILTDVVITPLEVSVSGHVAYSDWEKSLPKNAICIEKIILADGEEIQLDGGGGMGYGRILKNLIPTYYISVYENIERYKMVLEPRNVKALVVNGIEISVK